MTFYRGMRRVAIAIWVVGCVIAVSTSIEHADNIAFAVGETIGTLAAWSGSFWGGVYVIRWLWFGFAGEPKQP